MCVLNHQSRHSIYFALFFRVSEWMDAKSLLFSVYGLYIHPVDMAAKIGEINLKNNDKNTGY